MKHLFTLSFALLSLFSASNALAQCIEITIDAEELVFCPGDEVTLTATPGFDTYSWYYNFNNSNTGGTLYSSGENTLTLNASEWAVSYWYVVVNDAECNTPSETVVWDSWVFLSPVIAHDGNTNICPGDSSLIMVPFAGPGFFQWYKDFQAIEGANEVQYWVTEPGFYTVSVAYPLCPDYWLSSGIGPEFFFYDVVAPVISLSTEGGEPQLSIPSGGNVQWYLNGEEIEGANELNYVPLANGVYTVSAIDVNGCISTSEPFNFNSLSAGIAIIPENELVVYPNPFSGSLNIVSAVKGSIRISDLTGKEVFQANYSNQGTAKELNLDLLNKGIYMLEFTGTDGSRKVSKLMKRE